MAEKRTLIAPEHLSADSQKLFDVLNEEPDFAAVLVAVSFLDACLASLLERHFLPGSTTQGLLDPTKGALGAFKARADICYCLGLIEKTIS